MRAGGSNARGSRGATVFLAFNKGGQRYGIAISEIVEVQPFEQYTPVPGAPPFIPGVIHWRGAIISLLDLGQLAGIRESGLVDVRAFVLVESAGRRLGVLAGEVDELYSVPLEELKSPPELAAHVPPEWIVGVHDENRLVLRMDVILRDPRLGALGGERALIVTLRHVAVAELARVRVFGSFPRSLGDFGYENWNY